MLWISAEVWGRNSCRGGSRKRTVTGSPAMAPAADPDIPAETVPVTGASVSTPPAPPRQSAAPRAQNREAESRAAVHADFEPDNGIIRLSGPGVDAAFLLDLEHWLARRR